MFTRIYDKNLLVSKMKLKTINTREQNNKVNNNKTDSSIV